MRNTRLLKIAIAAAALTLAADPVSAGQAAEAAPSPFKKLSSAETADPGQRQGFSIVLLLGDMQGGESLDAVPAAARRALTDMKDFLPYKNYRLLDTQWTLCCSGGIGSAITRLRGVDDQEYELELRSGAVLSHQNVGPPTINTGRLSIRFFLRELDTAALRSKSDGDRSREMAGKTIESRIADINREIFALERERLDLSTVATNLRQKAEIGMKDPLEAKRAEDQLSMVVRRIEALKAELNTVTVSKSNPRAVIDTSFQMDVGESVVVGTSRLKGGSTALIAVLTAVGSRPKSR
jgi:hypothetical protein